MCVCVLVKREVAGGVFQTDSVAAPPHPARVEGGAWVLKEGRNEGRGSTLLEEGFVQSVSSGQESSAASEASAARLPLRSKN